jgi:DNA polymerase-3 subunit delta'
MAFSLDNAFDLVRRSHENARLAHAYLISGAPGSGKRALAADIVALVNKTKPEIVFTTKARSIFVAEPESKSRRILVEQVRELEHALQMRSTDGALKVAIIIDADRLQPQAANAFLKTLEEPPAHSLLLLLTALPETLPDTIISRCIPIPLTLAAGRELARQHNVELLDSLGEIARAKNWTIQVAYRLSQTLQRILGTIREEIRTENAEALKREEAYYKNATDGSWLENREDYYIALTESRYLQNRAEVLETVFVWWSDVLRDKTGIEVRELPDLTEETATVAARFSVAEILRRIRRLEEMRDHLGRNIQEVLAIEVAFLRVFTR